MCKRTWEQSLCEDRLTVDQLIPVPRGRIQFAWSHVVAVPETPGCYALVTYSGMVLYVGLASVSVQDRMKAHLETPEKRRASNLGVAYWFYYLDCPSAQVNFTERGWMNQAILVDGNIPPLNKIYSTM